MVWFDVGYIRNDKFFLRVYVRALVECCLLSYEVVGFWQHTCSTIEALSTKKVATSHWPALEVMLIC